MNKIHIKKKFLWFVLFTIFIIALLTFAFRFYSKKDKNSVTVKKIIQKPLEKYTIINLQKHQFVDSEIKIADLIQENNESDTYKFYFNTENILKNNNLLKVSGVLNLPKKTSNEKIPAIIMLRGFVPEETYEPGIGTKNMALFLAKNGYVTLAPDFLGFGDSDKGAKDGFENRFQTYTTVLNLLSSINKINEELSRKFPDSIQIDENKIGMWGHSNGGHIALTTLEISKRNIPTVLWAPVSKSFPYSILYYTDEFDDQGKSLRKALADFEEIYDTDLFSTTNYLNEIISPLLIIQGLNDQEVPYWWSDELNETLRKLNIKVQYEKIQQADHNFLPSGWNQAAVSTVKFFNNNFKQNEN